MERNEVITEVRNVIKDNIEKLKAEGANRSEEVLIEWTIWQILKITREMK